MPPQRLPIVNADDGTWGDIIRQFIAKEHFNDDTNNAANGGHHKVTIRPGTAAAGTAPLKFTTGTLLTTPEAGAVEFNGDNLYFTQATGPTRKKLAIYDDSAGATGDIYYRNPSGYFTRLAAGNVGDFLTIASGIPSWTAAIVGKSLDNTNSVTIKDTSFTIQDATDTTKQVRFDVASTQATGTTRTITLPNTDATLATLAGAETLSNKTLILPGVASPTYAQGKLVYDTDNESLTFYNNSSNVSMQVGQEQWIRVVNNTGSPIPNGSAVYATGLSSGLLTVALARSDAEATATSIGLTTEAIPNNSIGHVTTTGLVRNINTSSFTAGQTVYLSSTTAGAITATPPAAPNFKFRIGTVGVSNATTGTVQVFPATAAIGNGTSNQIFGMNSAATTQEAKSIVGTTNNITVTHTAGTITLGLGTNAVTATSTTTMTNKTLTGARFNTLNDVNGSKIIDLTATTSAVNNVMITNTATGSGPSIAAAGSDTNIDLNLMSKGSGQVKINGSVIPADENVVHKTGNETIAGNKSFTGVADFAAITYSKEIVVSPTGGAGNTANFQLNNLNGQSWLNSNNSGGTFAIYDQTNAKTPLSVQPNSPDGALVINASANSMSQNLDMQGNDVYLNYGRLTEGAINTVSPESNGFVIMPHLFNDIAFNGQRGGSVIVKQNGTTIQSGSDTLQEAFRPDVTFPSLAYSNASDVFTIEVTLYKTFYYAMRLGIAQTDWIRAKNVKIEQYNVASSSWTTVMDNTNGAHGLDFVGADAGSGGVNKIRYTLSNFTLPAPDSIRITNMFLISFDSGLGSSSFLPRGGGKLYGLLDMDNNAVSNASGFTDSAGANLLTTSYAPGATNFLVLGNQVSGLNPGFVAAGGDTNIGINLIPKGTGRVQANGANIVTTTGTDTLTNKTLTNPRINNINDTNGNAVLGLYAINSAVNYTYITNQSAGNYPTFGVDGSDANIGLAIATKGTGPVRIFTTTGNVPTLEGTDGSGNSDLNLKSNGTGKVKANNIEVVTISGSQTLAGKTLTAPVLSGTVTGTYTIGGTPTFPSNVVLTTGTQSITGVKTLTTPVFSGLPTGSGVASAATASTLAARDTIGNLSANAYASTVTTTVSSGTTRSITTGVQVFTGSSAQTATLPTTSVVAGTQYIVVNQSSGVATIQSSGANTISVIAAGSSATFTALVATPTTAAHWIPQTYGGTVTTSPRVTTITSSATPAFNTDTTDMLSITALATAITSMTSSMTGTPANSQRLMVRIKDNGTTQSITWGANFISSGIAALPTATVAAKTHHIGFIYDSVAAKWVCMAVDAAGY